MHYAESGLNAISPAGWLRRWLEIQKQGLTGHLEVAGYPYDTDMWACSRIPPRPDAGGESWWPYEQTAYWIDGMTRCGHLLHDSELITKAKKQFDYVLKHVAADGYLGPKSCRKPMHAGRWSHMIFFRGLIAHGQVTGDRRIIPALRRHYLSNQYDYSGSRDVCNIEIMCRLYEQTGDKRLLDLAESTYADYVRAAPDPALTPRQLARRVPANAHGVTFCETIKLGAILYSATGKKTYLKASRDGFRKLDTFHMLADGVPSSSEKLRGQTALDCHETCDIADYTWSAGYLFMATGDSGYLDRIEKACFNAAPGAVRYDFKALQYFSGPNQVVAGHNTNHAPQSTGNTWMSYRPKPGTECCTGQVNRIMPNYISRMWMRGAGGEVTAALYGPSRFTATVGSRGTPITITEETHYPFGERIDFMIDTPEPVAFALRLRIPAWCEAAAIEVNGKPWRRPLKPGGWVSIKRTFSANDRIVLHVPMRVRVVPRPGGGVSIERGPLLYALPIPEDWTVTPDPGHSTRAFPAWNCRPAGPWNYALDARSPDAFKVIHKPVTPEPWFPGQTPIMIQAPVRRVKGWKIRHPKVVMQEGMMQEVVNGVPGAWKSIFHKVRGAFEFTPPLPDMPLRDRLGARREKVLLVPYACTHLRIAIFPTTHEPA